MQLPSILFRIHSPESPGQQYLKDFGIVIVPCVLTAALGEKRPEDGEGAARDTATRLAFPLRCCTGTKGLETSPSGSSRTPGPEPRDTNRKISPDFPRLGMKPHKAWSCHRLPPPSPPAFDFTRNTGESYTSLGLSPPSPDLSNA